MNRFTIGIDCDLTVVDPVTTKEGWFTWLNTISGNHYKSFQEFYENNLDSKGQIDYNLVNYFPEVTYSEGFAFWRQHNLYDKMKPFEDAVNVINELALDYNILFVSKCQSGHFKSKVKFLKEHFNMPKERFGFNATHEKGFSSADVFIDDRILHLNQITNPKTAKVLFKAIFKQDEELKKPVDLHTDDWYSIGTYIKDYF